MLFLHKGPFIFLRGNQGVLVGFGEGAYKNVAIEGDHPKKIKVKRVDHKKYVSKPLKWHNVYV